MIRVWDFLCPSGHRTEHFVDADLMVVQCPRCSDHAHRQLAAPRSQLDGISGHFPSAADKWVRNRESHMQREQKSIASHNEYLDGNQANH